MAQDVKEHGYQPLVIEPKWQQIWDRDKTFKVLEDSDRPKFYALDMFPYPSGTGLHVGHPEGYTATDIMSRFRRMRGYNVLHPMGWDAFGLPAEQYALDTGQHPRDITLVNIDNFRRQIKSLGFSYDWDREFSTTDPDYYKWTQWIFIQLYNKGLAYVAEVPVNWCEALGTVLANEEVIDGLSERGNHPVVRKPMRQWLLRITAYAERLLDDLEELDWTEGIKDMQRNWIGKSKGAEVYFDIEGFGGTVQDAGAEAAGTEHGTETAKADLGATGVGRGIETAKAEAGDSGSDSDDLGSVVLGSDDSNPAGSGLKGRLTVFTTRPDTLFGATYCVLAPELELVGQITTAQQKAAVLQYQEKATRKSDLERTDLAKDKSGVFTGAYAINPVNGAKVPIWIADYVLAGYGTGAIMAVPGHDQRDWEFAKQFDIPIIEVIKGGDISVEAYTGDGEHIHSGFMNGMSNETAISSMNVWLETHGKGEGKTTYRLRDWLFSRQRYWGEPIPILHLEDGTMKTVPVEQLPLLLPDVEQIRPSGTGESPLANVTEWVNTVDPETGKPARRETNTMPQWAGSCWYYLRFIDPHNDKELCSKEAQAKWLPVDLYIGGAEHAVLHLLYARFWHKVLYDLGYVSTKEPFHKLVNQGMILGQNMEKMSKSRGNVINPDVIVNEFGGDTLRIYEMFMGPLEATKPWNTNGVEGTYRFLNRVWRLFITEDGQLNPRISAMVESGEGSDSEAGADEGANTSKGGVEPIVEPAPVSKGADEGASTSKGGGSDSFKRIWHKSIRKITEDYEALRFNTAISQLMIFVNEAYKTDVLPKEAMNQFVQMLSPTAPHIAEELWQRLGNKENTITYVPWPSYNEAWTVEDEVEIVIQVNGKIVERAMISKDMEEAEMKELAQQFDKVKELISGKTIRKMITVKGKLVNIVAG